MEVSQLLVFNGQLLNLAVRLIQQVFKVMNRRDMS